MVAVSELFTDLGEGEFGEGADEVHGDLAAFGDVFGAAGAGEVADAEVELSGDSALDPVDGDGLGGFLVEDVVEKAVEGGLAGIGAFEGDVSDDAHEGAFEFADVAFDAHGHELEDPGFEFGVEVGLFAAEDGDAGFVVGDLNLGGETPFEAGDEAAFEVAYLAGGAVAGEDDLFGVVEEFVEGVEELLLAAVFAGEEVDVVDDEDVDFAEFLAELAEGAFFDGLDELVGELLAGDVADNGAFFAHEDLATDGLHEVSFTEAGGAVEEEGVVDAAGFFSDGFGDGVGVAAV